MSDPIETSLPAPPPEPARRNPTTVALVVGAALAVLALAVVAVVAITNDDNSTGVMNGGHNTSMMGSNSTMNGPMMNGHGASNATIVGARAIAVTSESFKFTPSEIRVAAGETVNVALTSSDIAHDFTIDELDFHVAATSSQAGQGGLRVPATPGRYTAYCSVAGHRAAGMTATVIVDAA